MSTKIVNENVFLQACALFTMAQRDYNSANQYLAALSKLLGYEGNWAGTLGDDALDKDADFVEAFKRAGFTMRVRKKKGRK